MSNELQVEIESQIHERLRETQKDAYYNSLCVRDPEKWKNVAMAVYQGAGCRPTMKALGIGQHTFYEVKKACFATPDLYRKHVAENAHVTQAINDDNKQKLSELIGDKIEQGVDAKELLDLAKAQKELSVTGQIDSQRIQRLEGEADVIVKHEVKSPEELTKELEEMFSVKDAEVVEAEFVTENE